MNHIWRNPGASRKDLGVALDLHPNLVSDAVRELIRQEWVVECGSTRTGAGRAPVSLKLHPSKRACFAVSYDSRRLICALVNPNGEIIRKSEMSHAAVLPEDIVERISQVFLRMKRGYAGHIVGIGIADPGMVDGIRGIVVRSSTFTEWNHVGLAEMIGKRTGLMVSLEDSTRTRAAAQYRVTIELQKKQGAMLYLDYGEGLGFCLVTSEGVWRGEGFAGELGHVVVDPAGPLCRCGAHGCLENLAGSPALEARAAGLLARGVSSILKGKGKLTEAMIFQAAMAGDRMARNAVRAIMEPFGLAASLLVAAFHPRFVVVGAETETAIRCLCRELESVISDRTLPEISSTVEILGGRESRPLALTGAGLMVFGKIFMGNGRHTYP